MTAVNPARLKQQAVLLAEQFDEPAAFVRSLHHLLDFYADRVQRPGQTSELPSLLPAYRVRPQVLRQVLIELVSATRDEPRAGLALCDALWEEPFFEFRLLASELLGHVRSPAPEPILERVVYWTQPGLETRLAAVLLDQGLAYARQGYPAEVIKLAREWLGSGQISEQHLGLRVLLPLINDPAFQNLPVIFHLIQPLARVTPPVLRPELLDVLTALTRRSPGESAYFLRQTLSLTISPDTPLLVRECLKDFPSPYQEDLRNYVRSVTEEAMKFKPR